MIFFSLVLPSSKRRATTTRDQVVQVLGHELVYRSVGSGDVPLILLHGFAGDATNWEPVVAQLPCVRVVTLDLLGFGASSRPSVAYSLDLQRRYVIGFMDALGIEQAFLAGQSMGGSVTAWTAAHHPDRIRAIALLAPSAYPGALTHPWPRSWIYGPRIGNHVARIFTHNRLFEWLFPTSLARQAIGMTASYNDRFADALSHIAQPTLLLWSPGDGTVPIRYSARFLERISKGQLVQLKPQSKHDLAGSEPERVAELICELVRSNL